jgi:asparagine synthase (glutamine-hydrolysing)
MSYVSLKTYLADDYLHRLDTMGMQHSVEGRVPLLDHRLVECAFALPQELKVPGFHQKALFREAVKPLLPDYVTSRPKQGFCPPVALWTNEARGLGDPRRGLLVGAGVVSPHAWKQVEARGRDRPFAAWALTVLSAWVDQHLVDAA